MSYDKSRFRHPRLPVNDLGLTYRDYEGALSTLCAGCGHDAIGAAVIRACAELSLPPHQIVKVSGIGCSSKAPNYFLNKAHGFNSVHGRMPSVATGANLANRELTYIGMSGDGDSASIGLGQFAHVVRRRLNMTYLVANNGVYGLTKGQFSATAIEGGVNKAGLTSPFQEIDLCVAALNLGASFVARAFSGDSNQLIPLLKAAMSHQGLALIDIISPCVTFNNHPGSRYGYDYVYEHVQAAAVTDFVPVQREITVQCMPGSAREVCMHDGSMIRLHQVAEDYDARDPERAITAIKQHHQRGEILTGLLYIDPDAPDFHRLANTTDTPLNRLKQSVLCPGNEVLANINASFR